MGIDHRMIVLPLLLVAGFALCALLWTLAIYTLPALAGLYCGQLAYALGAGGMGAFVVGVMVAVVTLTAMRVSFARCRGSLIRTLLALAFVTPAVIVSYNIAWDITSVDNMLPIWRVAVSAIIAGVAGLISYAKLAKYSEELGAPSSS